AFLLLCIGVQVLIVGVEDVLRPLLAVHNGAKACTGSGVASGPGVDRSGRAGRATSAFLVVDPEAAGVHWIIVPRMTRALAPAPGSMHSNSVRPASAMAFVIRSTVDA